jgi:8-hydroxy-5-deazaflavin:NADPH oxidoreductase
MKISVLGTGSVGQALAGKLTQSGHEVFMGTRNVEDSKLKTEPDNWGNPAIGTWIKDHPDVKLLTFKEAVEKGNDLIVFAMNGTAALESLHSIGENLLSDKVMLDISNPLDFSKGFPPSLFVCNTESLGEQIQIAFPKLKVVKSLNTLSNPLMVNPKLIKGDHTIFMSGNDDDAKKKVLQLLNSFGWENKNVIDLGDITTARGTEMILPLWVRLYGKLGTPYFNLYVNTAKA